MGSNATEAKITDLDSIYASADSVDDPGAIDNRRRTGRTNSCIAYEQLIADLERREPSPSDFKMLSQHEAVCPSGRHSEEGVEKALDLPPGALRLGSAEHGLPAPRAMVEQLIRRHLRPSDL